jgi:hypothetical protein
MLTFLHVQFVFLRLRNMGYVELCSIWSTCNPAPIWRDVLSRLIDKWLTGGTVRTRLSVKTNACARCPCSSLTMRALLSLIIRKLNLKCSVSRSDRCNPPQCIACLRMRVFVKVSSLCLSSLLQLERKYRVTLRTSSYRGHSESPGSKTHHRV